MFLVTGGAGFIGSNVVASLNEAGASDFVVNDLLGKDDGKWRNLAKRQVADIEATYNDAFMKQVGRSAATDLELAEIVHDEETEHGLSAQDQQILIDISEAVKDEHYATVEARSILELKVERMKHTALLIRQEIHDVTAAIEEEMKRQAR